MLKWLPSLLLAETRRVKPHLSLPSNARYKCNKRNGNDAIAPWTGSERDFKLIFTFPRYLGNTEGTKKKKKKIIPKNPPDRKKTKNTVNTDGMSLIWQTTILPKVLSQRHQLISHPPFPFFIFLLLLLFFQFPVEEKTRFSTPWAR